MMDFKTSSSKPIFLVTHPRAISTAFERVFVAREKDITCVHEPFSDAYHWGPEKLSQRYEDIEKRRVENGYGTYTFHTALRVVNDAMTHDKRVFVKDMAKCLMPLPGENPCFAPSLSSQGTEACDGNAVLREQRKFNNPTVIPRELLCKFHFAFLIRNPRWSIPSLYSCSIPPKSFMTGWHGFKPTDAGYKELRKLFDYLTCIRQIGPGSDNEICIVDADDLLARPEETVQRFCSSVGIPFDYDSMQWGTEKDLQRARDVFKNWAPFHDIALQSTSLKRQPPKMRTAEADMTEWTERYGKEAAALIQKNVEDNMDDYLYLKQFALKPNREVATML